MQIDNDVAPLIQSMDVNLARLRNEIIPVFQSIDDAYVLANFSADEQARLNLAAAFTLIMSFYSYKRCRHEPIDPQLKLNVERVAEYVKKLREIAERERMKQGDDVDQPRPTKSAVTKKAKKQLADNPLVSLRIDKEAARRAVEQAMSANKPHEPLHDA